MSKVIHDYPPNYEDICSFIPAVRKQRAIVFTYAPNIYSPAGIELRPDLMVHEETHIARQKHPGTWWDQYLTDIQFRLDEELIAYQAQYQYMVKHYGRELRRKILSSMAADLSSPMYGGIINNKEAKRLIMEGNTNGN